MDLVVVGAGLYGLTVAREAAERGRRVLLLDARSHAKEGTRALTRGRPRHIPPGLTRQQWRDLRLVAAGQTTRPDVVARLERLGLTETTATGPAVTRHGRTLLDRWAQ